MDNLSLINEDKLVEALNTHSDTISIGVYRALVTDIVNSLLLAGDTDKCVRLAARCGICLANSSGVAIKADAQDL